MSDIDERLLEFILSQEDERIRDLILETQRKLIAKPPPDFDGSCECGAEIHSERITLGFFICIDCARERELRYKLRITG